MSNAHRVSDREVLGQIEVDGLALQRLKNREGQTFEAWAKKHEGERRRLEAAVLLGYPPPHLAAASVQDWEGWLGYCQQQSAIAEAFRRRAVAVARAILGKRGVKATESEAEARTWEQDEESLRWKALVMTLTEWLWNCRGSEKVFQFNTGSGLTKER
jgi:hypothetical protein